jgi:predicted P-loop ATPase
MTLEQALEGIEQSAGAATGRAMKVYVPVAGGNWGAEKARDNNDIERQWTGSGGVGVSMRTAKAGLVGIDLDHVIDKASGLVSELGREAIKRFAGCYVEFSPSGTGLRIFAWGVVPGGSSIKTPLNADPLDKQAIEIYPAGGKGRFLRVTGAVVLGTVGEVGPGQEATDWLVGVAVAAKAAKAGAGQPSPDNVKAAANDKALSLDAVFDALEALRPEREASEVIASLKGYAASKPRSKIADALKGVVPADWSTSDHALCCAVIRHGAGSFEDVVEVWGATPRAERGKFDDQKGYKKLTVEAAARAVLKGLREDAARGGRRAAPAAPVVLPEGLTEALALSGDTLTLGPNGRVLAQVGNVVVLFRNAPELRGLLGFNERDHKPHRLGSWQVCDRLAASEAGPVTKDDATRLGMHLDRQYGARLDGEGLWEAIEAGARDAPFNPLVDVLEALVWDGVPRVGTWLVDWLKVDPSNGKGAYIKAVGQCFLVGAVARGLSPGCQMDTVLSVEGSGGGGKSTAFRVLADALGPGLYGDGVHDVSSARSMIEGGEGRLIIEIPELAGVRKAEVEALKASITRQTDTDRRAYGRTSEEVPRGFVLVATTNRSEYLSDPSGALLRRFWPVHTRATEQDPIDRAGLAGVALQLWAEAVHLYRAGARWHIGPGDGEAWSGWGVEREKRREDGAFHDEVIDFLAGLAGPARVQSWSLKEIAQAVGDKKTADGDRSSAMGLGGTLTAMGLMKRKTGGQNKWFLPPSVAVRFYAER